ncbi:SDR family oxidoreductase [Microbacterium karelineae]|uniref:SDR family oxidoreductase n=1 Tax=Microbacterium karelineae TaxID=2654283 RepID=UPI0012EA53F8|nr:SDR family oxidoreductase [Microbacterium karelineae]
MSTIYGVTGASGHLGHLTVTELIARDVAPEHIVAIARTPEKVADLADLGVQVREGDYTRPDTLLAALAGVDRLLLVSSSEVGQRAAQHAAVIDAAKADGVGRIVYTSILGADTTQNPLAPEHVETETALRASGIAHTLLRNGWYIENYTGQAQQYLATGAILSATGDAKVSGAAREDYAIAAAAALLDDADGDRVYELGGAAFSFDDLAGAISDATGTTVAHTPLPADEYTAALIGAGVDEQTAGFLAALDATIAAGELETDSDDLARLIGRAPTPLVDVVRAQLA